MINMEKLPDYTYNSLIFNFLVINLMDVYIYNG